jgi:hypothetical protein
VFPEGHSDLLDRCSAGERRIASGGVFDRGTHEEDGPGTWETLVAPWEDFRGYGDPVINLRRAVRWRAHVRPAAVGAQKRWEPYPYQQYHKRNAAVRSAAAREAPMGKRLRLEDAGNQAAARTPAPGTEVAIAIDLSRTKWVYGVRWEEQRRLTTRGFGAGD